MIKAIITKGETKMVLSSKTIKELVKKIEEWENTFKQAL